MRIRWSSDAAQAVLRQMRDAEQSMADCLRDADLGRAALAEADPDSQSKTLNKIAAEFEAIISRLERTADDMQRLIRSTQNAKRQFEEAEQSITNMIDRVDTGSGITETGTTIAGVINAASIITVPYEWYTEPKVEPMPRMRMAEGVPAAQWLSDLLGEDEIFRTWM